MLTFPQGSSCLLISCSPLLYPLERCQIPSDEALRCPHNRLIADEYDTYRLVPHNCKGSSSHTKRKRMHKSGGCPGYWLTWHESDRRTWYRCHRLVPPAAPHPKDVVSGMRVNIPSGPPRTMPTIRVGPWSHWSVEIPRFGDWLKLPMSSLQRDVLEHRIRAWGVAVAPWDPQLKGPHISRKATPDLRDNKEVERLNKIMRGEVSAACGNQPGKTRREFHAARLPCLHYQSCPKRVIEWESPQANDIIFWVRAADERS